MYKAMKKNYVTPEAMDVEMGLSQIIATSPFDEAEQGSAGVDGDESAGDGTPDLSAGDRGGWGNLWK